MDNFLHFPPREEILEQLAGINTRLPWRTGFYETLATRLDSRVYDSAAFTFVLTELLYEQAGGTLTEEPVLLADVILALTQNRHLAISALQTLDEIHHLIDT
jgi:hypothetical protein